MWSKLIFSDQSIEEHDHYHYDMGMTTESVDEPHYKK